MVAALIAPPEFVDWDIIETFRFEIVAATADFDDRTLANYLQFVDDQGLVAVLDWQRLRGHRVSSLGAAGEELIR